MPERTSESGMMGSAAYAAAGADALRVTARSRARRNKDAERSDAYEVCERIAPCREHPARPDASGSLYFIS
jgi:hypothetical protein